MSQQSSPGYWKAKLDKLAGGPPNLEKIAGKSWLARHRVALSLTLFFIAGWGGPEIVTMINTIPDAATLETHQVTIIATQEKDPHFAVDMADGSRRIMEWPVHFSYYGGFRSYVWTKDERKALQGCKAEIQGVPTRWTIRERYRIWALNCPEKGIRVGMERTMKDYEIDLKSGRAGMFIVYGFFLFLLIVFVREGRGNL